MGTIERGRRTFIATAGATLLVAATGRAAEADEKVAPGEDLMREHSAIILSTAAVERREAAAMAI